MIVHGIAYVLTVEFLRADKAQEFSDRGCFTGRRSHCVVDVEHFGLDTRDELVALAESLGGKVVSS